MWQRSSCIYQSVSFFFPFSLCEFARKFPHFVCARTQIHTHTIPISNDIEGSSYMAFLILDWRFALYFSFFRSFCITFVYFIHHSIFVTRVSQWTKKICVRFFVVFPLALSHSLSVFDLFSSLIQTCVCVCVCVCPVVDFSLAQVNFSVWLCELDEYDSSYTSCVFLDRWAVSHRFSIKSHRRANYVNEENLCYVTVFCLVSVIANQMKLTRKNLRRIHTRNVYICHCYFFPIFYK